MRIVIVGAGTMGSHIARELSGEGHSVFVIERVPEKAQELMERTDAMVITGEALDPKIVSEAEVSRADLLLAVTDRDELNIVLAALAREFGVERTVARVRGDSYGLPQAKNLLDKRLEINQVVNPVEASVTRLTAHLMIPGASEVIPLVSSKAYLATLPVGPDCPMKDIPLAEFSDHPFEVFPLAVARYSRQELTIPRGEHVLREGEDVSFIIREEDASAFAAWFAPGEEGGDQIVIVGARGVGFHLAARLQQTDKQVAVVDDDAEECQRAAAGLNGVTVVRGRITEEEVLNEIDLARADFLVAASADEDYNLIAALWAKRYGARRALVVTEHPEYVRLLRSLDVDAAINPRTLAASEVLRFIRQGLVISVTKVGGGRTTSAEVLEFLVSELSPVAGKNVAEAGLPQGALIGLLVEGDRVVVPHGSTMIQPGSRALVFSTRPALKKVQSLFAPR